MLSFCENRHIKINYLIKLLNRSVAKFNVVCRPLSSQFSHFALRADSEAKPSLLLGFGAFCPSCLFAFRVSQLAPEPATVEVQPTGIVRRDRYLYCAYSSAFCCKKNFDTCLIVGSLISPLKSSKRPVLAPHSSSQG